MDTPLVSIIIPVFNSEESLPACLNALEHQSYTRLEIILVDDGSTDGSGRIIRDCGKADPRFLYISERNRGVSAARNTGLQRASGKYIMFVDSDDCCDLRAVERMVRAAEETRAEWIVGGVLKTVRGVNERVIPGESIYTGQAMDEVLWRLFKNQMIRQLWGKLYLGDIIRKNELRLREDMNCGEDFEWICRYLLHVHTMAAIPEVVYHYIVHGVSSLSQRFDLNRFYHLKLQYSSMKALFAARGSWQTYEDRILRCGAQDILSGYSKITSSDCPLSFREKIAYIRDGLKSPLRLEYLRLRKRLLPLTKELALRISSACFVTAAVLVLKRPTA